MSYLPSLSLTGLATSAPCAAAATPERPFTKLVSESDSLGAAATSYTFNNTWAASKGWTPGSDADAFTNLGVGGAVLGIPSDRTAGSGGSNAGNNLWARADQVVAQNPSHVTILIGANDFATVAPATDALTYYAKVKGYADYLRANIAGVRIGICGNFLRANAVANATAQALWALYRVGVGTDFDFYLPVGEHPVMTEAAYSNPTYSSDGLHPSAAGHDLYREVYAAVMDPIVAGATGSNPSAFTFTDASNQPQNTSVATRTVVTGMGRAQSATASVTGFGTIARGQGSAGTGSLTVINGDIVTSALTTASAAATERTQTLTIGTRSDVWNVTTAVSTPVTVDNAGITAPLTFTGGSPQTSAAFIWPGGGRPVFFVESFATGNPTIEILNAADNTVAATCANATGYLNNSNYRQGFSLAPGDLAAGSYKVRLTSPFMDASTKVFVLRAVNSNGGASTGGAGAANQFRNPEPMIAGGSVTVNSGGLGVTMAISASGFSSLDGHTLVYQYSGTWGLYSFPSTTTPQLTVGGGGGNAGLQSVGVQ